ncbi:hypothetical protein, partial [Escherichia coli]|uniref:hypothetical protein n=1 Tax=Escherichia coli TaxID=562 RepID=UPI001953AD46
YSGDLGSTQEGVEGVLLHSRDFFLERLDQWNVPVDDEIQHCVQHIVRALAEEIWRLFQVLAQRKV